MPKHKRWIYS